MAIEIRYATSPDDLPAHVAKQIGSMYLRRYYPNPAVNAIRGFKSGSWQGVLVWALEGGQKVLGWALKAVPEGGGNAKLMVFVTSAHRRRGLGTRMLKCCEAHGPGGEVTYYPHSEEAKAFYKKTI